MSTNLKLILCFGLLAMACNSSDKHKKPENLIPKDKMTNVLYDLYIINAAKGVNRKLLEDNGVIPEDYVLTKHNIDSTQFAESNVYYAFNADDYNDIVETVKDRIEKEKEKFEKLNLAEDVAAKKRRDSIMKLKARSKDTIIKKKTKLPPNLIDSLTLD